MPRKRRWITLSRNGSETFALPEVAVETEALDVDRTTNSIQVREVKITFPSGSSPQKLSLKIGLLALTRPTESETRYASEALKADDVIIAYGDLSGAAKSLTLSNVSVPKLNLKLQDPQHPFRSTLSFLKDAFQASWGSLSMNGLKVPLGGSPDSMISVAGIEAANVHDGVLGKLELAGLAFAGEDAATQISLGHLTFANLALKTLTDAFSPASTEGPKRDWIALGELDHFGFV